MSTYVNTNAKLSSEVFEIKRFVSSWKLDPDGIHSTGIPGDYEDEIPG